MLDSDAALYPLEKLHVDTAEFPDDLRVNDKAIGRGSNNKAYAAMLGPKRVVLRVPRRKSDTQQKGSALWEFRQTLRAAQLGVAPKLHQAFYARHASDGWTSGLYMIMDRYDVDLDDAIVSDAETRQVLLDDGGTLLKSVGAQMVEHLARLADDRMFVFDLKPSNIVLKIKEDSVDVRIVDFGRDFCEWCVEDGDACMLAGLRRRIEKIVDDEKDRDALESHILFATMLVQISSTTTYALYQDRSHHRMDSAARLAANPFVPYAVELLDGMRTSSLSLMRWLLRTDGVRGVMRHYHGRRRSGTESTLRLARGITTSLPCADDAF